MFPLGPGHGPQTAAKPVHVLGQARSSAGSQVRSGPSQFSSVLRAQEKASVRCWSMQQCLFRAVFHSQRNRLRNLVTKEDCLVL